MLKVSLRCQCDILCYRMPWTFWRLNVLIFWHNDSIGCRNLTTILNFSCEPQLPKSISQDCSCVAFWHQCPRFLLFWKYLFPWSDQCCFQNWFFEIIVSLQYWLVCQLLRKICFSCRPCVNKFIDLQDFCVICNFTQSIKFFVCLFICSFDKCLSCLLIRKYPRFPSVVCQAFSKNDALAERFPSSAAQSRDRVAVSQTLLE